MKSRILTVVVILFAAAGAFAFFELRREANRISECARRAIVLSNVSDLARAALYTDTDHFLDPSKREHEAEKLGAVTLAYERARLAAENCHTLHLRGTAQLAQELFLAAQEQRDLVAERRGNWLSYTSETAKAKTQFDLAKGRYELNRPWVG